MAFIIYRDVIFADLYIISEQYVLDMVRTHKRKTERDVYGDDILKVAFLALEDQLPISEGLS